MTLMLAQGLRARLLAVLACGMMAVLAGGVTTVRGDETPTGKESPSGEKTVVCLGDSITMGVRLKPEEKYPAVLETLVPGIRVVNSGIGGNTSGQGLARFQKDVLAHQPDVVVLFFGTNDSVLTGPGKYRVALPQYVANLREMIRQCRQRQIKVVFCTLLPINHEPYFTRHPKEYYQPEGGLDKILARYRNAVVQIGQREHVPVVDLYAAFAKDMTLLQGPPDGVHPNARGSRAIAVLVGEQLKQTLDQ